MLILVFKSFGISLALFVCGISTIIFIQRLEWSIASGSEFLGIFLIVIGIVSDVVFHLPYLSFFTGLCGLFLHLACLYKSNIGLGNVIVISLCSFLALFLQVPLWAILSVVSFFSNDLLLSIIRLAVGIVIFIYSGPILLAVGINIVIVFIFGVNEACWDMRGAVPPTTGNAASQYLNGMPHYSNSHDYFTQIINWWSVGDNSGGEY